MNKFRLLIIGLSILFLINTYFSTVEFMEMSKQVCSIKYNHPLDQCPHTNTLPPSSVVNFLIGFAFLGYGLFGFNIQKSQPKKLNVDSILNQKGISDESKLVLDLLVKNGGEMLQRDLITMTGFSKPKITRVLNKLESKGLVFRKRKGISNIVKLNTYNV